MQPIIEELRSLIRARHSIIWINTREEARVERHIVEVADATKYDCCFWDVATGITGKLGEAIDPSVSDPNSIFTRIQNNTDRMVFVLRDLHKWFDPFVLRRVRSLGRFLQDTPRDKARTIILLCPNADVPPELQNSVVVLDWPLPDRTEVAEMLEAVVSSREGLTLSKEEFETAVDAAIGLTAEEISSSFARSLVMTKTIDSSMVSREKRRVISKSGLLNWIVPDPRGLEAVGGLDLLMNWLEIRKAALTQDARDFGLPAPKGILLAGIPGCGKSLAAKAVAASWNIPLLQMDLGALRSKFVGESESNLRRALQTAETVAPCVLWLDELEKAIGGATQGAADGGVSADALGCLLSWMQEHTAPVFVIATTNNASSLPAELLRKGRWDEAFFVDLPNEEERVQILETTLRKFKQDPSRLKVRQVAVEFCDFFSGAEIAAIVPDAMFAAFHDGKRPLKTSDLKAVARSITPLNKSNAERLDNMRTGVARQFRPASSKLEAAPRKAVREIDDEEVEA